MSERIEIQEKDAALEGVQSVRRFRADTYALLGALLSSPPAADLLAWLGELEPDEAAGALQEGWQLLRLAAERTDDEAAADEYQVIFIGIGRGELVPYGSWYLTGFLHEKPLVLLRDQLAELGFERQDGVSEPEDHIGALCQVMAMLLDPSQGVPAATCNQFYKTHLQPFALRFFKDLQATPSACFYGALGRLGELFFVQENDLHEG